jgi:hypothetical protein
MLLKSKASVSYSLDTALLKSADDVQARGHGASFLMALARHFPPIL